LVFSCSADAARRQLSRRRACGHHRIGTSNQCRLPEEEELLIPELLPELLLIPELLPDDEP
jgi:hypothetical protein